jgi:ATP-dependent Clp protease ATP-binding subunit ClpA
MGARFSGRGAKLNAINKYPFERFTEGAKRTLVAAQKEAERMRASYIGTEHILLGMLRIKSSSAARVLSRAGITYDGVESRISAVIRHDRAATTKGLIPTTRVRRALEISFEESVRMGHKSVDTTHLLLGVVLVGEGIAALVLEDLGASAERVVAEVERELGVPLSGQGKERARRPATSNRDLQLLDPPPKIQALRDKLASIRLLLGHAVAARDTEHALKLGSEENRLEQELLKAERGWLDSLR